MKETRTIFALAIFTWAFGVSSCAVFDIGLKHEHAFVHLRQSFSVGEHERVTFRDSDTHILEHISGKGHSRVTSAHGYCDRILIEFRCDPDELTCTVVRGVRLGYRRGGEYRIRSVEDIWVKIWSFPDHFWVEGVVKISYIDETGKFKPHSWEAVHIEEREIEPTASSDLGRAHERALADCSDM